ncbi:MAG: PilT/PilU family type 4a pilus ATPase [Bacillota bacterium]|nr:PilT/PilU family type 4a pilus ATPase [Bacillota bacterium]
MNTNLKSLLELAIEQQASDVFIVAGLPVSMRKNGAIDRVDDVRLLPDDTEALISDIYEYANHRDIAILHDTGDDDFSFSIQGLSRFRVSAFKQRGALSAVIRIITFQLPNPELIGIPDNVIRLSDASKGMILVTGPAGSGKSTTLACMIDHINRTHKKHVITLEDPLEYLHRHNNSIVSQREINIDTSSYVTALRAALRQSPDVILLGEMRDFETINVAMTAAETGHLLLSTLHTIGAANTIDRIIDVFPANQQRQIAVQLSMVLTAVVSQQLVPDVNGNMVPAMEIMTVTPAIRNMIRENKVHQIDGIIYSSMKDDMISMDGSLLKLYQEGTISQETALRYASNPEMLKKKL